MAILEKKMAFSSALLSLKNALASPVTEDRDLAGIIKCFEFTFETGWKYLRSLLEHQGIGANTPRESIEQAYRAKMIDSENIWLALMKDRNLTVHTYDRAFAEAMAKRIRTLYMSEFEKLAAL
jgi:nucleotidyltransferase substrate binding protein (TIGR01987 family)